MQMSFWSGAERVKITKPIRLIELFGGIGCQAQALTNIGANFEHYRLCEFDKYAIASYNAIHGTSFCKSDIRDWSGGDLGICDTDKFEYMLTYSFPCQDLSLAGKQQGAKKGSGTRSGLLWEVERLLNGCQELPQILLMENVTQVHGAKNMEDFIMWLEFLESKGYKNYCQDLNATSYGVAQNRDRCFMVSCLGDYYYDFPQGIRLEKHLKDYVDFDCKYKIDLSKLNQTQKNAIEKISSLIVSKTIRCSGLGCYDKHTWNIYGCNFGQSKDFLKISKNVARTLCSSNHYGGYAFDKCYFYYSPKECWRLMGWQDEQFEKAQAVNSNSQLYKQAGNGICIPVLEKIFKEMS